LGAAQTTLGAIGRLSGADYLVSHFGLDEGRLTALSRGAANHANMTRHFLILQRLTSAATRPSW
jgi:hypothetical protein